jgi:hypothetical protein
MPLLIRRARSFFARRLVAPRSLHARGLFLVVVGTAVAADAPGQGLCFEARVAYPSGPNVTSIATGDLDADGDADIAVVNMVPGAVSILLNQGSGIFGMAQTYAIGTSPTSVAMGDLDGDGLRDLVLSSGPLSPFGFVYVLRNLGGGSFATPVSYPASLAPRSVAIGDLDGDGDLDVIAANDSNIATVSVLLNTGNGTLAPFVPYSTGQHPQAVGLADLDLDGDLDLVTPNAAGNDVTVLINLGNGTFAAPVSYAAGVYPTGLAIADFDGDGDRDLAVIGLQSDDLSVFMNLGNGTFAPRVVYATETYAYRIAAGDFDLDGDVDLVFGGLVEGVRLNQGNGTFVPAASPPPFTLVGLLSAADLDGDGDSELIGIENQSGMLVILRNCVTSGVAQCAGDGASISCPCANHSLPGAQAGCLNGLGDGATLRGSGSASLFGDALVLAGARMSTSAVALYYQGTAAISGGVGSAFGDGLSCAGGGLIRLGVEVNTGGASFYPGPGDAAVSASGAVTTAGERVYQVLYRDSLSFCTAATFNLTNGLRVRWTP